MEFDPCIMGDSLQEIRTRKGLSLEALADATGIRPVALRHAERGRGSLSPEDLFNLALAMDCTVSELVMDSSQSERMDFERALEDLDRSCSPFQRMILVSAARSLYEATLLQ